MLTEAEILSQHQAQLRVAAEFCQRLQRNAVETGPRGHLYSGLRDVLRKLEGTSRQMGHWRGDHRWFDLGTVYAKAQKIAHTLFMKGAWLQFKGIESLCNLGIRRVDELATRPTGKPGTLILPPWAMQ